MTDPKKSINVAKATAKLAAKKAPVGKGAAVLRLGFGGIKMHAVKAAGFLLAKPIMLGVVLPGSYCTYCGLSLTWDATKNVLLYANGCTVSSDTSPFSLFAGRAAACFTLFAPDVVGVRVATPAATLSSTAVSLLRRAACGSVVGGLVQGSVLLWLHPCAPIQHTEAKP